MQGAWEANPGHPEPRPDPASLNGLIGWRPETCMENSALQRGPIPVLSTERSPPNLAAALTRLRRSFLEILGQKPSANRSDTCRACPGQLHPVQFQSFAACRLQAEACRPFSGLRSARRRPAIGGQRQGGLSRLPGQIGLAWLVCRHAASVRGLRMATGTRYRCKLIHALETSGNKKHRHANGMPRLTLF